MTGHSFVSVPARTGLTVTASTTPPATGSIGLTIADGDLCIAIGECVGNRVMIARLGPASLDEFCSLLAGHLVALDPDAAATVSEKRPCARPN